MSDRRRPSDIDADRATRRPGTTRTAPRRTHGDPAPATTMPVRQIRQHARTGAARATSTQTRAAGARLALAGPAPITTKSGREVPSSPSTRRSAPQPSPSRSRRTAPDPRRAVPLAPSRGQRPLEKRAAAARPSPPPKPSRRKRSLAAQHPLQRRARRPRKHYPGVFRAGLPRKRLLALFIGASLVFGGILFRVGMLQTAEAGTYTAAGAQQRTRETVLTASRGVIFDRNGDELALSVPATTVFVNPKMVTDAVGTADALATVLQLTPEKKASLLQALTLKQKGFFYVARQIDEQTAANVTALKLAGVDSYQEDTRVVPGGDLGKGVIGTTDIDGKGTAGIELQYNKLLTGTDGELVIQHDRQGNEIPGSGSVSVPATPGKDLVLTIDRSIQFSLEQALMLQVSTLGAKGGTAMVEETGTGNVLAMASVQRDDQGVYHITSANAGAVDCYEPGSVAKVVTISAGLNENVVTPNTFFMVPGARVFDPNTKWAKTIRDAEPHPTESMSVHDILVQSSNNGTIMVSEKMGPEKQWDYMTSFGLGQKSALNFPGESTGILKNWTKWQGTENVTPAYGYGVCATAVQLIGAVNVVANNGIYVAPRLVQATIGDDGKVVDAAPSATHEVISPTAASQMNMIMRDVVCDKTGTANAAQVDGVTVAGKTGTGVKAVNGVYGTEGKDAAYYSSFVGFFPAEAPKVTTLISIDEPPNTTLARFGGTAAAPVFKSIVPTIMRQLGIQPPTTTGGCPKQ